MQTKSFLFSFFLFLSLASAAQDTTGVTVEKGKLLNHEIGFNLTTVLDQFRFFEASVAQSPHVIFYNLYLKDKVGLRLGGGLSSNSFQQEIKGQKLPTLTEATNVYFRAGAAYNFGRFRTVTFNVFGDYLHGTFTSETVNTGTSQAFPDPVITNTQRNISVGTGNGLQAGVGVKWQFFKNLCLYAEVPVSYFMIKTSTESIVANDSGEADSNLSTTRTSWNDSYYITLPTSVYLVLRF